MISHLPSLDKLIHELSKLPGIGAKTAGRLAYHILKSPADFTSDLSSAIAEIKDNVRECPECFSFTETLDVCHFCSDTKRSNDSLCVVEDPSDITRIENSGAFRGRYHVLHGALSPLDGITPQDLKIEPLLSKIRKSQGTAEPVKEVILALDADLEGDTTVLYLAKILTELGVNTTRIAHGVPIGGDIDYIDYRTLGRAIENRVQL
jgi:recombination protein RecR